MQALFDSWTLMLGWLGSAAFWRDFFVVLPALLAAAFFSWVMRRRRGDQPPVLRSESVRRLAFPLLAVLFLTPAHFISHRVGRPDVLIGLAISLMLAMAGVRIVVFGVRNAFGAAKWMAGLERSLATIIWLAVALNMIGVLPEFIDWLDSFSMHVGKTSISLWQVLQGVVTVIITVIVALWLGGLAEARLMAAPALDSSLRVVFSRIVKALLLFFAVLLGMSLAGLDITTLSVFGGALGVGLGLGMQRIASNYVSGFIILLDRSIRIGNLIQVGADQRGEVMQITTRYTVLRSPGGLHYIVPNELMVSSVVQNETFTAPRLKLSVHALLGMDDDIEQAMQIMEDVARNTQRVLSDPPPRAYLADFADNGLRLELAFWISDPLNGSLPVRSDIQRAVLRRFREAGLRLVQVSASSSNKDAGNGKKPA